MARRTKATRPREAAPAAPHPRAEELRQLDDLADLLDSRFRIPVVGWRFGLDGLLGLVPGIGDVAALGPSAYIVWKAHRMGASRGTIGRMAVNTGLDFVIGGIPLIGDVFDVAYKANRRNIALLKAEVERSPRPVRGAADPSGGRARSARDARPEDPR